MDRTMWVMPRWRMARAVRPDGRVAIAGMERRGDSWRASQSDSGTVSMPGAERRMAWQDGKRLVIPASTCSNPDIFQSGLAEPWGSGQRVLALLARPYKD
jgi:hypothetical protein